MTEKYLSEFNITLTDVVFGILISFIFEKYEFINTNIGIYLFFFTLLIVINYWHSYRKWFVNIISIGYKVKVYDVVADMGVLFVLYQLVNNYTKNTIIFYNWFIGIFIIDSIWVVERLITQVSFIENKQKYLYLLITNIVTIIVLLIVGYLVRNQGLQEIVYCGIMLIMYLATFVLDSILNKEL